MRVAVILIGDSRRARHPRGLNWLYLALPGTDWFLHPNACNSPSGGRRLLIVLAYLEEQAVVALASTCCGFMTNAVLPVY